MLTFHLWLFNEVFSVGSSSAGVNIFSSNQSCQTEILKCDQACQTDFPDIAYFRGIKRKDISTTPSGEQSSHFDNFSPIDLLCSRSVANGSR